MLGCPSQQTAVRKLMCTAAICCPKKCVILLVIAIATCIPRNPPCAGCALLLHCHKHVSQKQVCCVHHCMCAAVDAQQRRPSFRHWFSSAPHRPPPAQHATSVRPPAASRQRTSSSREQRSDNHPPRSTHNTEWRWNLGGPSTGGGSGGAYQFPRLPAPASGADSGSASASGSGRSTEWRWNLGGSWQPPSNAPGQGQSSRSSQAAQTDARSADRARPGRNSSGDMQRPWQRRRMLAGSPNEQEASAQSAANEPARSEAWEHSTAAGTARQAQTGSGRNSRQGWRWLLPRFLGQMMPGGQPAREGPSSAGVEVPAVQTTGMQTDVSGQHDQAAPPSSRPGFASQAADTGADAGWFVWSAQPAAMCLLCNAQPAAAYAVHCSYVPLSFIALQSYSSKGLFRCSTTCCVLATSDLCWKISIDLGTPFVVP